MSRRIATTLVLLLSVFNSSLTLAMWSNMSDKDLVNNSHLIVEATYIGNTIFKVNNNSKDLHLGVLAIKNTLKGRKQEVIFLLLPTPHDGPHKSDDLSYRKGQKGLWFLQTDSLDSNIYQINHPLRFIPENKVSNRINSLQQLLQK